MEIDPDMTDLSKVTPRQLLAVWVGALRELRARGVVRTDNNPIGDIAEELILRHCGGQRGGASQPSWDVLTITGERIQVKALRRTSPRRNAFSPIRSLDFDAVVLVVFDPNLAIEAAWRIPAGAVPELAGYSKHVNGYILRLSKKLTTHPAVSALDLQDEWLDS